VILVVVLLKSRCEPPGLTVCRVVCGLELVRCDADLDGSLDRDTAKS
jgi:hypothetical protein